MENFNNNIVSIIIPVYNIDFNQFEKCVNSCINQTYKNIEILIVANGVDDGFYKKVLSFEKIDRRIKVVRCVTKGVSVARNEGILLSKGNYIAFVDADDYIENNYIEKLLIPEFDIIICSYYKEYSYKSEKNIITQEKTTKTKDEFIKDLLSFQKAIGCVWGKLFNARYLKDNQILFDENLNLAEDAEFCLKAVTYNPKIIYVPDLLYHYIFSNNSIVRRFNAFYAVSYKNSLKKIEKLIDQTKYLIQWNNFVVHHLFLICVNYCFNLSNKKKYNEKKQILKEILKDDLFKKSLELCSLKDFPLTKKIMLLCLKYRICFAVYIISIIRNNMR